MNKSKISITVSNHLLAFMNSYGKPYHEYSRSYIIEESLKLLMQKELESAYKSANSEIDHGFEISNNDGL